MRVGILPIDDLLEVHFITINDANPAFFFKISHLESEKSDPFLRSSSIPSRCYLLRLFRDYPESMNDGANWDLAN